MNELSKIESFENSLAVAETFEEIKLLNNTTEAYLQFAKKQKISDAGINQIGEFLVKVVSKKGKWLDKYFPHGGQNKGMSNSELPKVKLAKMSAQPKESAQARLLAETPDKEKDKIIQELKESGEYVLPKAIVKKIKDRKKKQDRKNLEEEGKKKKIDIDFRLGDFEEVFSDIKDGSVDCIITDPPYPVEFIECWTKLSRFAKRVLKPHGYCIAYSGQMNLPEVIKRMGEYLDYYWTFSLMHTGSKQLINGRGIFCGWKPILIFQNGFNKLDRPIDDFITGTGTEKNSHKWQQAERELNHLIDSFTIKGDLICEPFAGGGTTVVAALKSNRSIIASEIDEASYNIAKKRISEWRN